MLLYCLIVGKIWSTDFHGFDGKMTHGPRPIRFWWQPGSHDVKVRVVLGLGLWSTFNVTPIRSTLQLGEVVVVTVAAAATS